MENIDITLTHVLEKKKDMVFKNNSVAKAIGSDDVPADEWVIFHSIFLVSSSGLIWREVKSFLVQILRWNSRGTLLMDRENVIYENVTWFMYSAFIGMAFSSKRVLVEKQWTLRLVCFNSAHHHKMLQPSRNVFSHLHCHTRVWFQNKLVPACSFH